MRQVLVRLWATAWEENENTTVYMAQSIFNIKPIYGFWTSNSELTAFCTAITALTPFEELFTRFLELRLWLCAGLLSSFTPKSEIHSLVDLALWAGVFVLLRLESVLAEVLARNLRLNSEALPKAWKNLHALGDVGAATEWQNQNQPNSSWFLRSKGNKEKEK